MCSIESSPVESESSIYLSSDCKIPGLTKQPEPTVKDPFTRPQQ